MSKGSKIAIIVIAVLVVMVFLFYSFFKGTYNRFVALDEGVKGAWAQVENQLQRRYDLIPNYVETVKGYAKHEREVLTQVTQARASVGRANNIGEKIDANNQLSSALSRRGSTAPGNLSSSAAVWARAVWAWRRLDQTCPPKCRTR